MLAKLSEGQTQWNINYPSTLVPAVGGVGKLESSNPTGKKYEGRNSARLQHELPSVWTGIREEFLSAISNPPISRVCRWHCQ